MRIQEGKCQVLRKRDALSRRLQTASLLIQPLAVIVRQTLPRPRRLSDRIHIDSGIDNVSQHIQAFVDCPNLLRLNKAEMPLGHRNTIFAQKSPKDGHSYSLECRRD